jgi:hypothetical protein
MIEVLGLSVGERPEGGRPFLLVAYGSGEAGAPEGTPVVRIPCRGPGAFETPPEDPIEIADRERKTALAFPPFEELPPGEALWRDARGRAAAVRSAGNGAEVRFAFDLVSPAHFFLSRREEALSARDELDRFSPESSWAFRRGLLGEPLVDRLGSVLRAAIGAAMRGADLATVRVGAWPEGRSYSIALTHDEDLAVRWKRRLARHAFQTIRGGGRGRVAAFSLLARDLREGPVPETLFSRRIAEEEARAGLRSTFFYLAVERDRFARRYRVGNPSTRAFLRSLADRGFAVGLHGGIESYLSPKMILEERRIVAEASGCEIVGVRQHYARLRVPETWAAQREAGLLYDASLGFPDAPGLRAGTSFPFRPRSPDGFLVLPWGGMDRGLAEAGVRGEEAWDRWSAPVRRAGGLIDILWHPYYLDVEHGSDREKHFRELISWVTGRKEEAWVATLDEIAEWWSARRLIAIDASRSGERTLARVRFGAPLEAVAFSPIPSGSDIRIEGVTGARAELSAGPPCRVFVRKASGGAEVRLSLRPRSMRREP